MTPSTDRSRLPEFLIALLLVATLGGAVLAIHAGDRHAHHWGPRAMARAADGNVWLVNDQELLIAGPDGELRHRVALTSLDMRRINTLAPWSAGSEARMLAGVIDLPEWLVMSSDGRIVDRIRPTGLDTAHRHTFHLAAAPDGGVAMATSGDHRVLLFDGQGKRVAESSPGLFRYANGLWHEDGHWWVVDTNHGRIRALDEKTLQPANSIAVPASGAARFPALARRSPAGLITVAEMDGGMERGIVLDMSAQGELVTEFRSRAAAPQPTGFVWIGDTLLVADRSDYSLQLFQADGTFLRNWGGNEINAILQAARGQRQRWANILQNARIGAIVFGALAIVVYGWWKRRRVPVERAEAPLSTLATPSLAGKEQLLGWLRLHWPLIAAIPLLIGLMQAPLVAAPLLTRVVKTALSPEWTIAIVSLSALLLPLLTIPLMVLISRRFAKKARAPEFEALLSTRWVRWLQRSAMAHNALEEAESVREILAVQTSRLFPAFNMHVWLLTDRRLLIFRPGPGNDGKLLAALDRRDCSASIEAESGWRRFLGGLDSIRVVTRDRRSYSGYAASPVTARRIAALLGNAKKLSTAWSRTSTAPEVPSPEPTTAFVLSLLAPGAAHLMQDRFQLGVVLLAGAGLSATLLLGPVLLGWLGDYYDVSMRTGVTSLAIYVAWALLGATDAAIYARRAYRGHGKPTPAMR